MWMFTKPDDMREPVVLAKGSKKEAQVRLAQVVAGHGFFGTWEQARVSTSDRRKLLKKFDIDTLYTLAKATVN